MAVSYSNVRTRLALHVSLVASGAGGQAPVLSITPPGFPDPGRSCEFSGGDQQLVDLEAVVNEYAERGELLVGEKLAVAAFLERMAAVLRRQS